MRRAPGALVILGLLAWTPLSAQTPAPPGPYVIDVRGTTVALPGAPEFFPPLPLPSFIPTRGFGMDLGAHVYKGQLGHGRLGFGASVIRAWGAVSAPQSAGTGTGAGSEALALPDVRGTLTAVVPQMSLNFGTADGWSYLSLGAGRGSIVMHATAAEETHQESGWVPTVSVGGGARWFVRPRVAVGFDVRVHRLWAGRPSGGVATPAATVLSASIGFSVR